MLYVRSGAWSGRNLRISLARSRGIASWTSSRTRSRSRRRALSSAAWITANRHMKYLVAATSGRNVALSMMSFAEERNSANELRILLKGEVPVLPDVDVGVLESLPAMQDRDSIFLTMNVIMDNTTGIVLKRPPARRATGSPKQRATPSATWSMSRVDLIGGFLIAADSLELPRYGKELPKIATAQAAIFKSRFSLKKTTPTYNYMV